MWILLKYVVAVLKVFDDEHAPQNLKRDPLSIIIFSLTARGKRTAMLARVERLQLTTGG
jgi:hypothetical protein